MKDKKKKIDKAFKLIILVLFAIFLTIFISNKYGYYEYKKSKQVTLTQEQIKRFEEDVKNGVNVEIENYLTDINRDYQTKLSQAGLDLSNSIAKVVRGGVNGFFKYINKLVS